MRLAVGYWEEVSKLIALFRTHSSFSSALSRQLEPVWKTALPCQHQFELNLEMSNLRGIPAQVEIKDHSPLLFTRAQRAHPLEALFIGQWVNLLQTENFSFWPQSRWDNPGAFSQQHTSSSPHILSFWYLSCQATMQGAAVPSTEQGVLGRPNSLLLYEGKSSKWAYSEIAEWSKGVAPPKTQIADAKKDIYFLLPI